MNAAIKSYYHFTADSNFVRYILDTIYYNSPLTPLIIVHHYSLFDEEDLEENPYISYYFREQASPIPCIKGIVPFIINVETEEHLTWSTGVTAPSLYFNNGDTLIYIFNCAAQVTFDPSTDNACAVCPPVAVLNGIPEGTGISLQDHEIEIILDYDNDGIPNNSPWQYDQCHKQPLLDLNTNDNLVNTQASCGLANPLVTVNNYGFLSIIGGMNYYNIDNNGNDLFIQKMPHPIIDRCYYGVSGQPFYGDCLTLCQNTTLFNALPEFNQRFALGMGGVYKLDRTGTNQQPLYFAFPYGNGIYYIGGPDMRLYYGLYLDPQTQNCSFTTFRKILQDYETRSCQFCSTAPDIIGYSANDITDILATTDKTTIENYWKTNCVTVGFLKESSTALENVYDFIPDNPPSVTPKTNLVAALEFEDSPVAVNSGWWYQVGKSLNSSNWFYEDDDITIHVIAKFKNGDTINEYRNVTLNEPDGASYFDQVNVVIRGDIKDYSATVINYKIEIFK